jgi:hypothetical protein
MATPLPVPSLAPLPRWLPGAAALSAALLLAFSGRYGYHYDELYFRVAAEHLAWGYVDEPPLVPALDRLQIAAFGDSLPAIRVVPALLFGLAVLLAALVARELGGGTRAQVLAAAATASSAFALAIGHLLHTGTVDLVTWMAVCWLVIRVRRTAQDRWWLPIGLIAGLGLLAKYLVALLAIGLAAGLLLAGPRRQLRGRFLWAGVGLAGLIAAPNIVWQATHDWPQLQMAAVISTHEGADNRLRFVPYQVLLVGPALAPIWVAGLVGLLRRPSWRPYRLLGVAYLAVAAVVLAAGGQAQYSAGLLAVLLAAGCVVVADWAQGSRARARLVVAAVTVNALLAVLLVLPVVPASWLGRYPVFALNWTAPQQVGWPEFTAQVAGVFHGLPAPDRRGAVILTEHYGAAAALDRFGPARHLPRAYSGHNSFADFGRPAEGKTVAIVVGTGRLAGSFAHCASRGRIHIPYGVRNLVDGQPVLVCRGPREPWTRLWPRLRRVG